MENMGFAFSQPPLKSNLITHDHIGRAPTYSSIFFDEKAGLDAFPSESFIIGVGRNELTRGCTLFYPSRYDERTR